MMIDPASLLRYTRHPCNLTPLRGYLIGYEPIFCNFNLANDSAFSIPQACLHGRRSGFMQC